MGTEDDLWGELWEFRMFRFLLDKKTQMIVPENEEIFGEVLNYHTNEFFTFNISLNMCLKLYPNILRMDNEEGYINYDFIFGCNLILISLITSLESYLERSFRILAKEMRVANLDQDNFNKFIKQFKCQNNYSDALKVNTNNEILLHDVLPKRMDFQQKDKAKIAYKLSKIDLPSTADEKHKIWENIFGNVGYISLRNEMVHAGLVNSILKYINGNIHYLELIFNASKDISKFVYDFR